MPWQQDGNAIQKTFTFGNFVEALAFVNRVGDLAEKAQHHPDIFMHGYKHVTITLTTHDQGGVTQKDRDLASGIEKVQNVE